MTRHTRQRLAPLKAALLLAATAATAGCAQLGLNTSSTTRAGDTPDYATASIPAQRTGVHNGVAAWDGDVSAPGMSAAHPTLMQGSWARVTNTKTGQSAVVRVTRRLENARDRDIELSRDAAVAVGALHEGFAPVLIEPVDPRQANANEKLWTRQPPVTTPRVDTIAFQPPARPSAPRQVSGYDPTIATSSIPSQSGVQIAAQSSQPAAAAAAGPRYLQIGSFRDAQNAHRTLATIQAKGLTSGAYGDGFIQTAYVGGSVYHRVRLGPIESKELADRALQEARGFGHADAQVLRP